MTVAAQTAAPFVGALAGFADVLRWVEDAGEGVGEIGSRSACLACFQSATRGPWRPACSLWGQLYFNRLLIPATCLVAGGWRDDACAQSVTAVFCPKTGAPQSFALFGERRAEADAERALIALIESHIGGVIDDLAVDGGLSKRMLWEGAERSLHWAAARIAESAPVCGERLQAVARRTGRHSRLARAWTAAGEGVRRFCCLRYQISGCETCPGICPRSTRSLVEV